MKTIRLALPAWFSNNKMVNAPHGLAESGDNDLSDVEVIDMLMIAEDEQTGEVDSMDMDVSVRTGEGHAVEGLRGPIE